MNRVLVWFSCGAASAIAAKMAIEKYGDLVEICYCNTLPSEHPDNARFLSDIEKWVCKPIKILSSTTYVDTWDVWEKTRWLVGPKGARCTTELKKVVRNMYQQAGDLQIFGFTAEEKKRWKSFLSNNPEVRSEWILKDISKKECLTRLLQAGIQLPMMYHMGYKNNNCIGCVKGQAGYWNKIRKDFPNVFNRMAKLERRLNVAINKKYIKEAGQDKKKRVRVFLDELPPNMGRYSKEPDIECGVLCGGI